MPQETQLAPIPYSHQGEIVEYQGRKFKLGAKALFVSRKSTIAEETDLLRRQYAFGGCFAYGKTYRELLQEWADRDNNPPNMLTAIREELARDDLPATQEEMRAQFESLPMAPSKTEQR